MIRKRIRCFLGVALAAVLSVSLLSACKKTESEAEESRIYN